MRAQHAPQPGDFAGRTNASRSWHGRRAELVAAVKTVARALAGFEPLGGDRFLVFPGNRAPSRERANDVRSLARWNGPGGTASARAWRAGKERWWSRLQDAPVPDATTTRTPRSRQRPGRGTNGILS